uniref:GED domain-containing protein n=1 Tax=Macrostomum lignano TaxID=282301 RepID=A0A1I8FGL8_9PLAT
CTKALPSWSRWPPWTLSHNPNLTSLPDEIGNLSKLWEMPLDGLKLSARRFAYPRSNPRTSSCWSGSGGRGKTSLLRALMKLKQPERQSPPTVGIAVTPWSNRKQKWVTYQLSCWDFAGQEEFYGHPSSCSNSGRLRRRAPPTEALAGPGLSCQSASAPTDTADTCRPAAPNRDTIIANIRTRIETMIRRPGFPEIVEYVEVNAIRDNASVERLRTVIQSALEAFKVKGHHVMGQMVPESYVKLETLVMERARNTGQDLPVLQWYQLRQDGHGRRIEHERREAEPGLAVRMMAQIVTVKEINGFIRSGVMRQSDLGLLFTGKRDHARRIGTSYFPVSQIPQYLRILEKFEIVLPQKNDELLIPCRLPDIAARDVTELAPVRRHSNLGTSSSSSSTAASSPCAPSILKMGKRVMFACWQPPATGTAPPPQLPLTMRPSFCCKPSRRPPPRAGKGLQLQVPLCPNGAYLLAQIADNIDVVIEEWYPGLTDRTVTGECILQKRRPLRGLLFQIEYSLAKSQQQHSSLISPQFLFRCRVFIHSSFDDIVTSSASRGNPVSKVCRTEFPSSVPLAVWRRMLRVERLPARFSWIAKIGAGA